MTTSLGIQFSPAVTAQLLRSRRGVKRLVAVGHQLWNVTLTDRGLELRERHRRFSMTLTWSDVLKLAEHRAGEQLHQERLRAKALRRIARGAAR
jgi:hypothetical protein